MDQGIRNPVLRILVYGHVWLALGAAAQTAWMQELLGLADWRAPVLAFCGTIVGYTFMRWARMDHPELGSAPHLAWFRAHRKSLFYFALFCLGCGTALALPHVVALFRTLWPALVLTLFYVVPPGLVGGRTIGLRRLPLLKALLIAAAWALVTVGLPLALNDADRSADRAGWLFAMQSAFFLALAITFDLRDRAIDPQGLRTIPQVAGPRVAKALAIALLLYPLSVFLLMAGLSYAADEPAIPPSLAWEDLLAAAGFLVTAMVVVRSGPGRGPLYHDLLVDGMLVLVPLLWWIGTLV
jgi:hypothetical protein